MSPRSLNELIWRLWREGRSLEDIARAVSDSTHWSGHYSLVYAVAYLHGKRGVRFTRRQLRRAFRATQEDVAEENRREAWLFLEMKGGLL